MHLAPLIRDLAIILGVAGLITLVFQRIRQPVVLGYILAGVIVGPYTPPILWVTDVPSIQTWAELGVIFLMFSLGLEFSFRKLAQVGVSAGITAGSEVLFFLPFGFVIGRGLGWTSMDSLFLGAMLSISSTTIIIKALDELKLKTRKFAEIIFAVLIVEDLIAILLLVGLSTVAVSKTVSGAALLSAAAKLILVVGGWFLTGYFVVPRFMKYVGRIGNNETILIVSLGLCLALVVFANQFHYSTALGAFIMGSILAESPLLHRIERQMESLRDLFGAIFFVSIGMLIDPRILWDHMGTVAILCVATILGKIFSTSLGAILSGQSLRNSIQVGFGLAQIGEFSFIIATLGLSLKAISDFVYPIIVAVSLVTTFTTPYLIRLSGHAASSIERKLPAPLRDLLTRYAAQSEAMQAGALQRKKEWLAIMKWGLNGILVSVIFVLTSETLLPYLAELQILNIAKESFLPRFLGWSLAALISSPFIWAMLSAFRASSVFTVLWVAALSFEFFPGRYVAIVTTIVLMLLFGLFYRRLESSYQWLEKRFLSSFEKPPGSKTDALNHLAPWDAHLVKLEVHPNANLVLKTIRDAALRSRYGLSIVGIQRGSKTIVSPPADELILPKDELAVLGTDEQIEQLRKDIEAESQEDVESEAPASDYELRQFELEAGSPWIGKSIRQSGIRERLHALVVGIERRGRRIINPDSDTLFEPGDILWIAGEKSCLNEVTALEKSAAH